MYSTITHASQFRDQFHKCGRGDQFSYEALGLLFNYLEEVDPDYDLDVIALCCEYMEATPEEIASSYDIDPGTSVMDYLAEHAGYAAVTSTGAILFAQF